MDIKPRGFSALQTIGSDLGQSTCQRKDQSPDQNRNRSPDQSGLILLATLLAFICLGGCASFHGNGSLKDAGAGSTAEDHSTHPLPTLSLTGEREVIKADENPAFDWPLDEARMTRGFILGGRSHWGIDLANQKGTPIMAADQGVVIYTGRGFHGYGNLIVIEHNEEWASLYSHLQSITVKEGESVARGQKIGTMGRTGHATGVHLHFEIRHNHQPVNPLAYLPEGF